MRDVGERFVVVLVFLMGRSAGIEPNSGYCVGNQCFTVVKDPSNFTTAQNQCIDQGGHLMTVRSTVAHNILLILLGTFAGRFWIGLHLKTGCPDDAADLKGFQWVTKDSDSELFNWAPSFDSSCSSHRCVSVSKEGDFKWIREPCDDQAAGFLCEYSFSKPCKSLAVAEGQSVTYDTPTGFVGQDLLSLPPKSVAARMPHETEYVCLSEQLLEILKGGCELECTVDPKQGPSCYCLPGKSLKSATKVTCEVAAGGPCGALGCEHACYKNGDSYACKCEQGPGSPADLRGCTDPRPCPSDNSMCVMTDGEVRCVCKEGYVLTGDLCVDEDECVSAPCEHICVNTQGSYNCSCYDGYRVDHNSPIKCQLHCGKEECPAECDSNDAFQCYCPDGYIAEERNNHTVCIDIDECFSMYCDQHCENTFGSFVCSCHAGYTLVDGVWCKQDELDTVTVGELEDPEANETQATPTTPYSPYTPPTTQPSVVTVWGLVGIILGTVFVVVVVVVFLVYLILKHRGKMERSSELKAQEDESHGLKQVISDKH